MRTLLFSSSLRFLFLSLGLCTLGCPAVPAEEFDAGPGFDGGARHDAAGAEGGVVDAASGDAAGLQSCRDEWALGTAFAVDPGGIDTQIHAALAFDGRGLWVAYSLPDDGTGFDIFLTRLACDGSVLTAPFKVNTTDANDLDPDIAIGAEAMYLVWQSDNGTGVNNMDVYYRVFHLDGSPRMATDRSLETIYDGAAVEGNVMSPTVLALPSGGFAITALRGIPAAAGFQSFVQRIDDDGALVGAAIDGYVEDGRYDSFPSIAARSSGEIFLSYVRGELDQDDEIVQARIPAGASIPDPQPPRVVASTGGDTSSHVAVDRSGDRVYLGYGYNANIVLLDGADFSSSAAFVELGGGSGTDYAPRVVPGPGGGAVFWYRNISGFRNQFRAQAFDFDGSSFVTTEARAVTPVEVPPYAPAAVHVDGDVYAAAWSEGTSPDFRLSAMFISLP